MTLPSFNALTLFALCTLLSACTVPGTSHEELDDLDDAASDATMDVSADLDGTTTDAHDADTVEPDTAQLPDAHDDVLDADDDDTTASDQTADTKTPIADGWCWLTGANDVVCEDGSTAPVPASCHDYVSDFVRFDDRIDLYIFAALGCTTIPGTVLVVFDENLTTLTGLDRLEFIGGYLSISDDVLEAGAGPVSLEGLGNLREVGGSLIVGFTRLDTLEGLGALQTVGDKVTITFNSRLSSLRGLQSLSTIEGTLEVSHCPTLLDLTGLENLERIAGNLLLHENDLDSLTGLDALSSIGGGLGIRGPIRSLVGMPQVRSIASLTLEFGVGLESLDGLQLERLAWPGDDPAPLAPTMTLHGNPDLRDITALGSIQAPVHLAGLHVRNNHSLTRLDGLDFVASVDEPSSPYAPHLNISGNNALTSFEGLSGLESVGRAQVSGNASLTTLWTHDGLSSIADLELDNNDALTSLGNVLRVTNLALNSLTIRDNDRLPDLTGLDGLTSVDTLVVEDNDALQSLTGLDDVTVLGELDLENNAALTTVTGLEQVTSLQHIEITGNPSLNTLAGLIGLQDAGTITLRDIPLLTTLDGLDNVRVVDTLTIHGGALTNLQGLGGADLIGKLELVDADTLVSLEGLGAEGSKIGRLVLTGPDALATGTPTRRSIVESLRVADAPMLTDFGALAVLDLSEGLSVARAPLLTALPDMSDVDTLYAPGGVRLDDTGLTHLDALSTLREVWGHIVIRNNPALQDISGLSGLEHVHEGFTIVDNPIVPQCQAEALPVDNWFNNVTITGNDTTASCP